MKRKRKLKKSAKMIINFLVVPGILLLLSSVICIFLIAPVNKQDKKDIEVTIQSGASTKKIAEILKNKGLIKSKNFFFLYTKINRCKSLKASTYTLNKSMTMDEILKSLCEGNNYNPNTVIITFQEGKRIPDYAKIISEKTNNTYEDVINIMNDKTYIKDLQNKYWFITDDVFNQNIYYPLEGLLAPDTYHFKNKNVKPQEIIEKLLDQTYKNFHPYKNKLENKNHTINEYITLASMTELEGKSEIDRKKIVGVFENRLKLNMNLGSDVTTYYGIQKPLNEDLTKDELATINGYNTRTPNMKGKLPVGPICSISISSIKAAMDPDNNDYYFFVADKNGKIYYNKTNKEHEQKVMEIKEAGDWIW